MGAVLQAHPSIQGKRDLVTLHMEFALVAVLGCFSNYVLGSCLEV